MSFFVGREGELEELLAAVGEALSSRGSLRLLSGEPGIGKTTLATQVCDAASARGARVTWGRAWDGEGAPPYWPWVQIVRALVAANPRETMRRLSSGIGWVGRMVPEFAEVQARSPAEGLEPEHARFRVFDETTRFLRAVASDQPLVLVLDDLHWADKASIALLRFLANELADARILVLGTYREAEMRLDTDLAEALGALVRAGRRIALEGLAAGEVARLIEHSWGRIPSSGVVERVLAQTDGNPFFLDEVVRLGGPGATSGTLEVPGGVREAIARNLAQLPAGTVDALRVASVVGQDVDARLVDAVSGRPGALEVAVRAGVLLEAAAGRYRFRHALTKDALYAELPSSRRAELHGEVASALDDVHRDARHPPHAELAHHFAASGDPEGRAKARVHWRLAGERARGQLAYEEAASYFRMALETTDGGRADPGDELDDAERCDLLTGLGEALNATGEPRSAQDPLGEAAQIAERLGDSDRLGRAALAFGGRWLAAGVVDDRRIALLERAVALSAHRQDALRVRLLSSLAQVLYFRPGSAEERTDLAHAAVALARDLGDRAVLAEALGGACFALWGPENLEDRLRATSEMLALARESQDRHLALRGHEWRFSALLEQGDAVGALAAMESYSRIANDLRDLYVAWSVARWKPMWAILEGRFDEGERLIDEAAAIGMRTQNVDEVMQYSVVQTFALRREQGRLPELEDAFRLFMESYPGLEAALAGFALMHLESGRPEDARAVFERLAADDFARIPQDWAWLIAMLLLAQVCYVLGDTTRAAVLYRLMLPHAGRCVVVGAGGVCAGSVSHYLALLASALDRLDEAEEHFDVALRQNAALGAVAYLAHTRREYAAMLVRRGGAGDLERARPMLESALETFERLGVEHRVREVAPMLESLRKAPRADGKRPPTEERELRREGDVWTLSFGSTRMRLRDAKGLRYIAELVSKPGREVHVVDLVAVADGSGDEPLRHAAASGDAGEMLDATSREAYRRRLEDLRSEIDDADRWGDPERSARAQEEMDVLLAQLSAGLGLGGRSRRASAGAERARQAVTKAIRAVVSRVATEDASLGHHLSTSISTGVFCSYTPDPGDSTAWSVTWGGGSRSERPQRFAED